MPSQFLYCRRPIRFCGNVSCGEASIAGFVIEQRLKIARREIRHYRDYDYLIINEEINSSTLELQSIILGARCRTAARSERAESVIATFGGIDAENP